MGSEGAVELTVTCPHCSREFTAAPMTDDAGRPTGFKCPHCRLFVPYERAEELHLIQDE
jgi:DNA-directed RNA polymerase subunit RPC12/RpoP